MHKITGNTTLAELAVLRASFGVQLVKIDVNITPDRRHATVAHLITSMATYTGTGETEAEALDDAFARLQHRIGSVILASGTPLEPR